MRATSWCSAPVCGLLVAAVAVLAVAGSARAQQEPPPIAFADTTVLSVTCDELAKQARAIEILNERGTEQTVHLRLSKLRDAGGALHDPAAVCDGVRITESLTLPPAQSADAALTSGERPDGATATYSGTIAAYTGRGAVIRRSLELRQAPARAVAKPRVDSVSATLYRGQPGDDTIDVPIAVAPDKKLEFKADDVLGGVAGDGDGADVTYSDKQRLSAKTTTVRLSASGLGAGSYEGKADLIPSDEETGAVTLKLTVKDWWPYAVAALLAGIVLALLVQRVTNVSLPKSRLLRRVDNMSTLYEDARRRLATDAAGKPWAAFGISDLGEQQQALRTKIDDSTKLHILAIDEKVVEALEAGIKALEDDVSRLDGIHDAMTQLATVLDQVRDSTFSPLPERTGADANLAEPALIRNARGYLTGAETPLAELKTRLADAARANQSATELYVLYQLVSEDYGRLLDLERAASPKQEKDLLEPIFVQLGATWSKLWNARNADRLAELDVPAELDKINDDIALAQVAIHPRHEREADDAGAAASRTLAMRAEHEVARGAPTATATAAEEKRGGNAAARALIVVAVSLVVALVTGLTALYIGKPFGSFWDYVAAITWGLTTQAALATLTAALGGAGALMRR